MQQLYTEWVFQLAVDDQIQNYENCLRYAY